MNYDENEERWNRAFLGNGWSFPPSFNDSTRKVEMVSEEEDIRQSIFILLSTIPGERIMKPNYGCDLHRMVFERLNANTRTQIIKIIEMAILHYEPRITVTDIQLVRKTENLGIIHVHIKYIVRKTNSRSNMVYPFYLKEGSLTRDT